MSVDGAEPTSGRGKKRPANGKARAKSARKPPASKPAMNLLEADLMRRGRMRIAGVDEAGRGPLAGPVVAACVVLNPMDVPEGIRDSKTIAPKRRAAIADAIRGRALAHSVGEASVAEIERLGIDGATMLAMARAVTALAIMPDHILFDGMNVPTGMTVETTAVVDGDATSVSCAAASILAKERQVENALEMHALMPAYGFDAHKGYGTKAHLDALRLLGPSPWHRKKFGPVKALIPKDEGKAATHRAIQQAD